MSKGSLKHFPFFVKRFFNTEVMRTILLSIALLLSGISTASSNEVSLHQFIRGNWNRVDNNQWEYGIYDSVCIIQNRMCTTKSIKKQGECIELVAQDRKNTTIITLLFTPQPNGDCLIKADGGNELLYTKKLSNNPLMTTEADFEEVVRKDTAYLQGYIDRYDPESDTDNKLISIGNEITGEDCPIIVNINPDGTFECKLALSYPINNLLQLGNHVTSFYIEPGQTLSIYIDYEGNYDRIKLMGPSTALSQLYDKLRDLIKYPDEIFLKAKEGVAPERFKKEVQTTFSKYDQNRDSLIQIYATSEKAVHLIKNKVALKKGITLLNFALCRSMYAAKDTTNQALKAKEGND